MALTAAERLLQDLGVSEPGEIDLEAIAYHLNARVQYKPLDGCEARIVGAGDRAVITVNNRSGWRRNRFSIAHELGHWHHHKGKRLVCRADDYRPRDETSPERVADGYAADLLLPHYLFKPLARQQKRLTFKAIGELADVFAASITATAIRLVEADLYPALVVCHGPNGRKWFARAPMVPRKWFPQSALDAESAAFGVQFGSQVGTSYPSKIGADAWFDCFDADRYEVLEQTLRTAPYETVSLITITDGRMLEDGDGRPSRRW
ncbi:MAG: ImmA/IrrE family metallo-endopeptidase [Hyphomicrobiaceae bacterium]